MDTDDLSAEAYQGIIIEAEKFNHDLTLQFGVLASSCKNEEEYLNKASDLVSELQSMDEEELIDVFFGNLPDTKSLNLTLKKIFRVAMLSENHLLRNFGQVFNTSPLKYITQLKIAEAKRQIIRTDRSVTEIALALGYSSLSNFSYYFKNIVGLSPVSLRKKVRYRK